MAARPIDIARKLKISTTTLRTYEAMGLVPPVSRSASGYRIYSDEHVAYFVCVRALLPGFSLTLIAKILQEVMAKNIETALWMVNEAQAALHREKMISEKIVLNLLHENEVPSNIRRLTIHEVSSETGVPATTIRYWDKVGLLSVERDRANNYRLFTAEHIRQILTIYALKFSVYGNQRQYSVVRVKEELQQFDEHDSDRIMAIARDIQQQLAHVNRVQIKGMAALYHLCVQVEMNRFNNF
jgi:DNA-binding transcriptional MerR regulator